MPANSPPLTPSASLALVDLGSALRERRKALRVSAAALSEAAGISRVTLHRIEKGQPSVTLGAYAAALGALGLELRMAPRGGEVAAAAPSRKGWLPARIDLADYPKLRELAWQLHGDAQLRPREALDIYERNWRHVDPASLDPAEQDLVDALRAALGDDRV